jgi:hypothetical protein
VPGIRALKKRYDPASLFRINHNVPARWHPAPERPALLTHAG